MLKIRSRATLRHAPTLAFAARPHSGSCGAAVLLATAAAVAAPAGPAFAQGSALEEIVVTAQRREETVQSTPLSITALGGADIEKQSARNLVDLNTLVPGLQVGGNGNSVEISMRGIASTNNTEVGDPAVAFNLDGVYLARSRAAGSLFYDVERIEVLRGPQGTLYGRNATAGAVNLITAKPRDHFEAAVSAEGGNYDLRRGQGMINVPFSEVFSARVAASLEERDSYYDTGNAFKNYGAIDNKAGRIWFKAQPSDALSILIGGDYWRATGGPTPITVLPLAPGADPYRISAFVRDADNDQRNYGTTWQVDLDVGFATLTYLGAKRWDEVDSEAGSTNPATPNNFTHFVSEADQDSHELRLTSDSGPVKWVAGLYYFKEHNEVYFGIFPLGLAFLQPDTNAKSKAAFGQATWSVTDDLRLTAGLRYTEDRKNRLGGTYLFVQEVGGQVVCPFGELSDCLLTPNIADHTWSSTNYRLGVDYDLTPDSMLYASVATGYKAGGYGDGPAPFDNPYGPEELVAYELGSKNQFWGRRGQLNASAFFYKYDDLQVSALGTVQGQAAMLTQNAAKAEISGAELEFTALVGSHGTFDANAAYLRATFKDFFLPLGDQFGAPADYSGNSLARSPKWTLHAGYEHAFDLPNGATLRARLQTSWQDSKNMDFHGFAVSEQGSYSKSDASVTYDSGASGWNVMAYVRNIEDEHYLVTAAPNSNPPNSAAGTGTFAAPRTYGLALGKRF